MGKTIGKIFGAGGTPKVKTPVVPKPAVMPTPDDQAVDDAKKAALLRMQSTSSRASTDLFDKADLLGG